MKEEYRVAIAQEFERCVTNTITRLEAEDTYRPFHRSLLSDEALFWSRFERSFSTSFGQRVIEQISRIAALAGGADAAENQRHTNISLSAEVLAAIDSQLMGLRNSSSGRVADWASEVAHLQAIPLSEEMQPMRVISDLWWEKDGVEHFMSIKTVKPNLDQTVEAKRDLLKLKLAKPNCRVFFGFYYNPYGENLSDYTWSFPRRIFDFSIDEVIVVGRDYWDLLGGFGFYDEVTAIAAAVGEGTRAKIRSLRESGSF